MIQISNNDAASLRRLLGRVQGMAGIDTNSKELKRKAKVLAKVLNKKIENNGKARSKLLQCRHRQVSRPQN